MRAIFGAAIMALLAGCVAPRIDAGRYAVDYNRAVEIEANETILLNIVRARYRAPTHYTSTQSVSAELKASRSASIGVSAAEGALTEAVNEAGERSRSNVEASFGGSAGMSLSYAQEPNFSIAVLNTQDFARGTSAPIAQTTFSNFVAEGYRAQMLIALLVRSIKLTDRTRAGNSTLVVDNPNGARGAEDCRAQVFEMVRDNVELRLDLSEQSASLLAVMEPSVELIATLPRLSEQGFSFRRRDGQVEIYTRRPAPITALVAAERAGAALDTRLIGRCFDDLGGRERVEAASQADGEDPLTAGGYALEFAFRSPDGSVYAMGEYLRNLAQCERRSDERCSPVLIGGDQDPLFELTEAGLDAQTDQAIVHTEYLGRRWLVRADTDHRTMQVINIIQKLINLNKSADELRLPAFIDVN